MNYVALFRGLNVGGKNSVKMADLTQCLMQLGLLGVRTYVQSGNAVFASELDERTLAARIQTAFADRFGFESHVMVRSADEMRALVERLPFSADETAEAEAAETQAEHLYVYFVENAPTPDDVALLCADDASGDQLFADDRALYLLCRQSVRTSKLASRLGRKLGPSTARNWNTVQKLCEMLSIL